MRTPAGTPYTLSSTNNLFAYQGSSKVVGNNTAGVNTTVNDSCSYGFTYYIALSTDMSGVITVWASGASATAGGQGYLCG